MFWQHLTFQLCKTGREWEANARPMSSVPTQVCFRLPPPDSIALTKPPPALAAVPRTLLWEPDRAGQSGAAGLSHWTTGNPWEMLENSENEVNIPEWREVRSSRNTSQFRVQVRHHKSQWSVLRSLDWC